MTKKRVETNTLDPEAIKEAVRDKELSELEGQEKDLIQHAQEMKANINLLMNKAELIDVSLPNDVDGMWEYVFTELNTLVVSQARAGFGLMAIKASLPHGQFLPELEAKGIRPRTAQDSMTVAKLLMRVPKNKIHTFIGMKKTTLIELARLPDDVLNEVAESDEINGVPLTDIDTRSRPELRKEFNELIENQKAEKKAYEQLLAEKNKQIDDLNKALNKKPFRDEEAAKLRELDVEQETNLQIKANGVLSAINQMIEAMDLIRVRADEVPPSLMEEVDGQVSRVANRMQETMQDCGVVLNLDGEINPMLIPDKGWPNK